MRKTYVSKIGRRVLLILVIMSSLITLTTTVLQLYWDYNRQFDDVRTRHTEVRQVYSSLIASSLWFYDVPSVEKRLQELNSLPKVDYLEVWFDGDVIISGEQPQGTNITNRFPLVYTDDTTKESKTVGELVVTSSSQDIYDYLIRQFFISLGLNAIRTTLVCSLLFLVFHHSINQRVMSIVRYLRQYYPRYHNTPLRIKQQHWTIEEKDELSWVAEEVNKLTRTFTKLYQSIKIEQEKLQDFTDVSSDWLWETNAEGKLRFCSGPMKQALEIDLETEPELAQIERLKHAKGLRKKLNKQQSFSLCEEKIEIHGQTRIFVFQAIARYSGQQFLGYRGTAINVTELKRAQVKLEKLNQSLEDTITKRTLDLQTSLAELKTTQERLVESEKLGALGGLVAGVAHEVNTPLGIAVTATTLVEDNLTNLNQKFDQQTLTSEQFTTASKTMGEGLAMLKSNLDRATTLVRDFKRTAVDQISEDRVEFNIQQVLRSLLISLSIETSKIPVTPTLTGDDTLMMDSFPGVLSQAMSNLILNSLRHAFEHSDILPQISISYRKVEHSIIIEYADNGSGVEPALHNKIFEPFYTTIRGMGGSGLGLNLVYNLVKKKLQGELAFNSNIQQGVRFTLTLPQHLQETTDT
ncbi:ATP-binding protein [Vibrio ostreicida]|uniref:histidine kinase n=2 Tax=Vibrio ostreicida TaxID=526588 RepID=A0ABT8BTN2_9VIBR|nr:ATP-binding protein [Vibrio ostreicida]MDN3610048.1 ATP-binding protein [Vibrio ostreicida]NPD10080.1 ATP-binding protein [Vibrio ostreicida]